MTSVQNTGKLIKNRRFQQEAIHRPHQPELYSGKDEAGNIAKLPGSGLSSHRAWWCPVVSWAQPVTSSFLGLYSCPHLWVGVFLVGWKSPAGFLEKGRQPASCVDEEAQRVPGLD